MCRNASLWQLHLDSPHGLFNDLRKGFPLKVPAPIHTRWPVSIQPNPLCQGFFSTFICNLNICKCEGRGDASRFPAFDLQLENVLDRIFNPPGFCVGGMIEICGSRTGCSRPLYVSLSRRAPLITLGCLPVPRRCEQESRSLHGPLIYDCQSNSKHLLFPVPLRSPHRDFDKCATEVNHYCGVLINWQQSLLSH